MYKVGLILITIGLLLASTYFINYQQVDTELKVVIPSIGVNQSVNFENIDKGVYYDRAVLFGHRTTHGSPFFNLDKVVVGDEVIFNNTIYIVDLIHIEDNSYTIKPEPDHLYLVTCTPIGSTEQRIIIEAIK